MVLEEAAKQNPEVDMQKALAFGTIDEKPADTKMYVDMLAMNKQHKKKDNSDAQNIADEDKEIEASQDSV